MALGRRGIAAVLGLGALGAAAAAFLPTLASPSAEVVRVEAARAGEAALARVDAAAKASADSLAAETMAAAAVPQLHAAIADKVDAFTLDDLFKTEDWWTRYRARTAIVVAPEGVLGSRNVEGGPRVAAELAAAARAAPALASDGDRLLLVASAPVGVAGFPGRSLVLGAPVDEALGQAWAAAARAGVIVLGGRAAVSGGAPRLDPALVAGREREGTVVDRAGAWAATPGTLALGGGARVWIVTALAPASSGARVPLTALAAALALAALGLSLTGRRALDPGAARPGPTAALAPTLPVVSAGDGTSAGARRATANLSTVIANGDAQVFGRYTVLDRIGAGGMCDIYTAALTGPEGFQRTFVLKRLKPALALNRAAVDQFIDEAKLGSTLVHSNIVPVFDFGRVGDGYFIAQEYIVGRNVLQICERHAERLGEPLDVATVFYVAHETLQALGYAHDKTNDDGAPLEIVHRDVSPGNIIVSRLGEVKLIDFGIVKAASGSRVSETDLGNVKGNAAFMSPEQARGHAVDRRSDLFSLGLVMFRALAGEPFYGGSTTAEVFYRSATGPTEEHFARIDLMPPVAARILKRALVPDAADRYATAEEFAADLAPHIPPGTKAAVAALVNALFGAELKSGGTGVVAPALRRDAS